MASMVFYQARGCSKVSPSSRFSHLLVSAAGHLSSWSRELRGWTEVCYGGCFPLAPGKCCYRSSQCFLFAQIQAFPGPAMTKARQLSPEGGEKCGFFLRGRARSSCAAAPQKYSVGQQYIPSSTKIPFFRILYMEHY